MSEVEKQLRWVRKVSRLAQNAMKAKEYPMVNLALELLVEVGTKKAALRKSRKKGKNERSKRPTE